MAQTAYKKFALSAALPSPERPSGAATPPLHAAAAVPFRWEEQPGKPRPCTDLMIRPEHATKLQLDPPPCRMTKMPSPTTVLDGPYVLTRPRFASFRLSREKERSFDSSSCGGCSPRSCVDHGDRGAGARRRRRIGRLRLFGRRRGGEDEGSLGFSPCSFAGFEKMERNESFSRAKATTPLWATMFDSLKHAMPWKITRKSKKEGR